MGKIYKAPVPSVAQRSTKYLRKRHRRLQGRLYALNPSELKYIDASASAQATSTSGTISALSLVAEGDDLNTRDGRTIYAHSMSLRISAYAPVGATTGARIRFILFSDGMSYGSGGGVLPTVAEVLTAAVIDSHYNRGGAQRRFTKYFDVTRQIAPVGSGNEEIILNKKVTFKGRHRIDYLGTASTQASQGKGGMYLLIITDTIATMASLYNYNTRILFTE